MESFNSRPSSSSSARSAGRWTYDVFLSFRGEDTRHNFVDHLYAALVQRGIYTFKDNEKLQRGKTISQELLKAIEGSRCAVVVFSENYANSSWCLEELARIMECKDRNRLRVLPVFYHVDPSDVRKQKGSFDIAFQQHEEKFKEEMEKVKKWREALTVAASTSGWDVSKTAYGSESKCINEIVQEVLCDIKPHVMDNLIGMESRVQNLSSLVLGTGSTGEVRMIGVWGMGGIGKTTIAQALFRRIAHNFEGSSFVEDVRVNSTNQKDICALQEKILRDILMMRELTVWDPDFGVRLMRSRLSNKKVLLVLDDVDDVKQLEFLAATPEWFGPGSRIIITTRDEHLLSDVDEKYKPRLLLMDQAIELFSRHAFHKTSPPEGYEELSYRAVYYAGFLPLALKVLGSFFHGRPASVWGSALNRLAKAPNAEIFETLKLSFDGLDVSEKNIFLDIACFFKGKEKEHVTRILDSFGFDPVIGISVLIEKSLLTVSRGRLDMHDLIQEMGWQIVRENFPYSRLWQPEEIHDIIMRNRKTKAIEAIMLQDKDYNVDDFDEELGLSDEAFRSMKNLRLLDIDSDFSSSKPPSLPNLQWLCWYKYPFFSLQLTHMRKLVGLEMHDSSIQHLWEELKILPNLKFINLSESRHLTGFPDVSGVPNLERLILSYCRSLVEVHHSVGFHKRLVYLDLRGCSRLKFLLPKMDMESLETLILSDCINLERFPEMSPCMGKLSKIYLDYCRQIEELPSSIRLLSGLSFLNLTGCTNLKNLPTSICELKHLKSLCLHDCQKLQRLPEDIGSLEQLEELWLGFPEKQSFDIEPNLRIHTLTSLCSLRRLDLSWCQFEEEGFPKNLHTFSSLEELLLSGNSKLIRLPASISHLSRLKLLELSSCSRLETWHELPSGIQVLKAEGCSSLKKTGDLLEQYEWLYKIWLFDCHKLLEYQENDKYLAKMMQKSFLQKCAVVKHRLSIAFPGSKIPSWFSEQRQGSNIALKLPPEWHTKIMGFAVCGVFYGDWDSASPGITFKIVNDEKLVPKSEAADCINIHPAGNGNVWVSYIPFGFFQQMYHDFQPEDWSHIEGHLVMTLTRTVGAEAVKCGAHILYKKDVELIACAETCISDYGNMVQIDKDDDQEELAYEKRASANTYVYKEKSEERNLSMMRPTSKTSKRLDIYNLAYSWSNMGRRKFVRQERGRYPQGRQDSLG